MVTFRQCILLTLPLLFCQCETKRTVKSTRSNISFDNRMWGGQGSADTAKIDAKFAQRGYTLSPEGSIVADHPDLFRGKTSRSFTRDFQTKEARLGKAEAKTKQFRTPEYLKRQEFTGVTAARDGSQIAREGNFGESSFRDAGKGFEKKAKDAPLFGNFGTSDNREAGKEFRTREDQTNAALADAPRPKGTPRSIGYQDNVSLSMDDVKKMLNPSAYAEQKKSSQ